MLVYNVTSPSKSIVPARPADVQGFIQPPSRGGQLPWNKFIPSPWRRTIN